MGGGCRRVWRRTARRKAAAASPQGRPPEASPAPATKRTPLLSPEARAAYEKKIADAVAAHDAGALEALFESPDAGHALLDRAADLLPDPDVVAGPRDAVMIANIGFLLLKRQCLLEACRRGAAEMQIKNLQQRVDELEARAAKSAESGASLERRASRHGEHLARLEDRLRRAEGKA